MARQEGNQRFIGRIGDLVYYKRKGVYLVRKVGSPSKKRIKEDPEFDKTRKLNCEFGAAAKAGHDFRFALAEVLKNIADCDLTGRVQGLFAKVIHHGNGECGSRSIEILKNANEFIDFQFNRKTSFNKMFYGGIKVSRKSSRKEATITISAFDPATQLGKFGSATHLRFCFTLLALSDYSFIKRGNSYKVINRSLHCHLVTIYTNALSLTEKCKQIHLVAKLLIKTKLPKSVGVIAMVGMEFYKEENGIMYIMPGKNCMQVKSVF